MKRHIKYQIIRRTNVVNPDNGSPMEGYFVIADDLTPGQVTQMCRNSLPRPEQRNSREAYIQEYENHYDESKPLGQRYSFTILRECKASDWLRNRATNALQPV